MEITRHGELGRTNGNPYGIGEVFPSVSLDSGNFERVDASDLKGKYVLISIVPDIDTRVCSLSTKKFNQEADKFENIGFYTISTNSVAKQQQWCAAEGVERMKLLSDLNGQLGKKLGIYVEKTGNDARSIWILDKKGRVAYRELITEQSNEPDYQKALAFLREHTD
ncbi:thiol peroxidase [Liquorilactobacillus uvarum]|uniref:Thioredoxin peroxidase n=1 Tax=Liquorilactobacillus uvarum DSM 19971 TaxID=1423812 RepID=A0A0R1PY75_9LACO|nr:peroxiredoxin [Liquorilactobacillus uvarum]KRL37471.1 thioredoxin peroxidase [Liquorilactobacillus uvarum DSM 19971]